MRNVLRQRNCKWGTFSESGAGLGASYGSVNEKLFSAASGLLGTTQLS